jgi:hypothetical protein
LADAGVPVMRIGRVSERPAKDGRAGRSAIRSNAPWMEAIIPGLEL